MTLEAIWGGKESVTNHRSITKLSEVKVNHGRQN